MYFFASIFGTHKITWLNYLCCPEGVAGFQYSFSLTHFSHQNCLTDIRSVYNIYSVIIAVWLQRLTYFQNQSLHTSIIDVSELCDHWEPKLTRSLASFWTMKSFHVRTQFCNYKSVYHCKTSLEKRLNILFCVGEVSWIRVRVSSINIDMVCYSPVEFGVYHCKLVVWSDLQLSLHQITKNFDLQGIRIVYFFTTATKYIGIHTYTNQYLKLGYQ